MAQRTTPPALLRLSPVELGHILAFLPPHDLYLTATSVCRALSSAATEAWELWPAAAAADKRLRARVVGVNGSDAIVRTVHEWQWRRVVITREMLDERHTRRQRWHRVSEDEIAAFIAGPPRSQTTFSVNLNLKSREALFSLMPCSASGRRDVVCGAIRPPMLKGLARLRFTMPVTVFFATCGLASLGAVSEVMLALQKSKVCAWLVAAEIAGVESFIRFVSPWVKPFVGELPSSDIVQALVGDRAWRIDQSERVLEFFRNTVPLTTLHGLTPIQKELFLSLHGFAHEAVTTTAAQSLLDARDVVSKRSWNTLFGTPGASGLAKTALVAGVIAGVVTAIWRRRRSPITSQSRLYRPSSEVPQHQGTLRGRLVSIAHRWREPLILTLDTLWLRFAFATGASLGDHINSLFVVHAIAILDDVLSRCSWTPSAKTTLATVLAVWGVGGFRVWWQGQCATKKIRLGPGRNGGQANAPYALPLWKSKRARFTCVFHTTACLCAAAAALRVYDAAGLQRFGYRVLAAVSASAYEMGPLPPIDALMNITSTHDRAGGLGPFVNASLPYAEQKQYLNRTALTAFVASRPLIILLRGVMVGAGSFVVEKAATVLKQQDEDASEPPRQEPGSTRADDSSFIDDVVAFAREGSWRAYVPHVAVGTAAAYVAAVEGRAALRCEMYPSNVVFSALVFAVATTIGDTVVGLL